MKIKSKCTWKFIFKYSENVLIHLKWKRFFSTKWIGVVMWFYFVVVPRLHSFYIHFFFVRFHSVFGYILRYMPCLLYLINFLVTKKEEEGGGTKFCWCVRWNSITTNGKCLFKHAKILPREQKRETTKLKTKAKKLQWNIFHLKYNCNKFTSQRQIKYFCLQRKGNEEHTF